MNDAHFFRSRFDKVVLFILLIVMPYIYGRYWMVFPCDPQTFRLTWWEESVHESVSRVVTKDFPLKNCTLESFLQSPASILAAPLMLLFALGTVQAMRACHGTAILSSCPRLERLMRLYGPGFFLYCLKVVWYVHLRRKLLRTTYGMERLHLPWWIATVMYLMLLPEFLVMAVFN